MWENPTFIEGRNFRKQKKVKFLNPICYIKISIVTLYLIAKAEVLL